MGQTNENKRANEAPSTGDAVDEEGRLVGVAEVLIDGRPEVRVDVDTGELAADPDHHAAESAMKGRLGAEEVHEVR
jgi:hypothetical protein